MDLAVKNVRYFETNRGLGYRAKTNLDSIYINNDGMGGGTYIEGRRNDTESFLHLSDIDRELYFQKLRDLSENELEELLDIYEKSQGVIC